MSAAQKKMNLVLAVVVVIPIIAFCCWACLCRLRQPKKHAASIDRREDRHRKHEEKKQYGHYMAYIKMGRKTYRQ
jgi:hypothetical protein